MSQTLPLKDVREQLSDLVSRVAYGDQKVVITKFGKPVAALVTFEDYEKIMNPAKHYIKEEWDKGFITKAREASKNVSDEEANQIIEREISAVRSSKNDKSRS